MARKKIEAAGSEPDTNQPDPQDQEEKTAQKSKRKAARRKKEEKGEPDLSALPNNAGPVQMDSVITPVSAEALHHRHHSNEKVEPELMRDIKPREFRQDATFLVPEKFGFELGDGKSRKRRGFARKMLYFIGILIALMLIALAAMTYYSAKLAKAPADSSPALDQNQNAVQNTAYTLAFANVAVPLKNPLTQLIQSKFNNQIAFADNTAANLPAIQSDTLFIKQTNQQQTDELVRLLGDNGIKAQIQQIANLPTDAVLDLVPILQSPDLSGLVAAAYNATSTNGLAKQTCKTLLKYKVVSCNALNAPAKQTGTTINYKEPKVLFNLYRTTQFQKANFAAPAASQVEDIRVTVGN